MQVGSSNCNAEKRKPKRKPTRNMLTAIQRIDLVRRQWRQRVSIKELLARRHAH